MSSDAFLQIGLGVILIVGFAFVAMVLIKPYVVRRQVLQNGVLLDGCIKEHRQQFGGEGMSLHFSYGLTFSYEYQGMSYTQEVLKTFLRNEYKH